jgi:hypothetical protein
LPLGLMQVAEDAPFLRERVDRLVRLGIRRRPHPAVGLAIGRNDPGVHFS